MKKALLKSLHIDERTKTIVVFILAIIGVIYFFDFPVIQHIDITKYPENVQNCYNEGIYSDYSCTKNKRTILKYCECLQGLQPEISRRKNANLRVDWSTTIEPYYGTVRGFASKTTDDNLNDYIKFLYEKCAKKTGYKLCD